ncbi:MAG: hypothetical protein E7584_03605 [Ruminococcaceae bacterium]|nr:hypothetical protein [Oscillospiraceae bacterium]
MSENNITDISIIENVNVSEADLPDVISQQFESIVEIDRKIQEAEKSCATAKDASNKMILAKALNQKDAINATQDAVRSLADSQTALTDAQKMLFENQQKMAIGMRYLLILGASSIAMNRVVIAELEAKLKQASKEQLSQKAREELIGVIKLLREQESAFSKQDRMSDQIKSHGSEIETIHRVDAKQDETDKKHDSMIAENASKNVEQDKRLDARVKKDVEQDKELKKQQKIDKQHEEQIQKIKKLAFLGIALAITALIIALAALLTQ